MPPESPFNMDRLRQTIIIMLIATLIGTLVMLFIRTAPADNKDFINIIVGFFIAKAADAIAYLLNTTARSHEKDRAIAEATQAVARQADAIAAAPAAAPPPSALIVEPPADVELRVREAPYARNDPDPQGRTAPAPDVPLEPGLPARDGRPAE